MVDKELEIYVALLGEGVDVWRPVRARHISGNIYRIVDQFYKPEDETWEFTPGTEVICKDSILSDQTVLVAISERLNADGED